MGIQHAVFAEVRQLQSDRHLFRQVFVQEIPLSLFNDLGSIPVISNVILVLIPLQRNISNYNMLTKIKVRNQYTILLKVSITPASVTSLSRVDNWAWSILSLTCVPAGALVFRRVSAIILHDTISDVPCLDDVNCRTLLLLLIIIIIIPTQSYGMKPWN